ncbi:MAG: hypothetical protein K6E30_02075 [Lachnospiraceae bacterium]|nr:hypothetical protein [Lachnospiraceae bacterium]
MFKKIFKLLILPAACAGAAVGALILAEKAILKDRDIKVVDAAIKETVTENENTEDEEE